ncbi:hypothetical protein HQ590_06105 [bacterium]|nr:hypothetical protein [bacterium]
MQVAEEFGLDNLVVFGQYTAGSLTNDYIYGPGGGHAYSVHGCYGDLPEVSVELRIRNEQESVWYERTFHTPAGDLHDVIQWSRPNIGYGDGPNPHHHEPLVKTRRDLDALRYLYPAAPRPDLLAEFVLARREVGERAVLAATDCVHGGCWALEALGTTAMLVASVEDPALLADLGRIAQAAHLRNLRALLERGLEVVIDSWFQAGPSVGWSPGTYRALFLPLVKEAVGLAHEFGARYVYQDDGKMREIIPMIVEAGVDAISGLQPPAVGDVVLRDVKARFGSRVALIGGLDPCYTFDRGSPETVRAAIRQAVADAGAGGGYVLGTAEAIDPGAPRACLVAAVQAAKEFGAYAG